MGYDVVVVLVGGVLGWQGPVHLQAGGGLWEWIAGIRREEGI